MIPDRLCVAFTAPIDMADFITSVREGVCMLKIKLGWYPNRPSVGVLVNYNKLTNKLVIDFLVKGLYIFTYNLSLAL